MSATCFNGSRSSEPCEPPEEEVRSGGRGGQAIGPSLPSRFLWKLLSLNCSVKNAEALRRDGITCH